METPPYHGFGHIMSTLSHALFHTGYRHLRRRQAQEKQFDLVSLPLPARNQPCITTPAQCRFKSETFSLSRMFMNLAQHQPACANGHTTRLKGAQSFSNQVSVDEDRALRFVWQIFPGKRRLARTIRPRNYEYSFSLHSKKNTLSPTCVELPVRHRPTCQNV